MSVTSRTVGGQRQRHPRDALPELAPSTIGRLVDLVRDRLDGGHEQDHAEADTFQVTEMMIAHVDGRHRCPATGSGW